MAWQLSEWESEVSSIPYYFGDTRDVELVDNLSPGIYVVREVSALDTCYLSNQGFRYLDTTLELTCKRPCGPKLEIDPRIQLLQEGPEHDQLREGLTQSAVAYFWRDDLQNRLYKTLSRLEADSLMACWVGATLTTRAQRVGVLSWDNTEEGGLEPAGFISVCAPTGFSLSEKVDLLGVYFGAHNKGFGKALVQWAVSTMRTPIMKVRTEHQNIPAIRAYESAGFQVSGHENLWWARVDE